GRATVSGSVVVAGGAASGAWRVAWDAARGARWASDRRRRQRDVAIDRPHTCRPPGGSGDALECSRGPDAAGGRDGPARRAGRRAAVGGPTPRTAGTPPRASSRPGNAASAAPARYTYASSPKRAEPGPALLPERAGFDSQRGRDF